MLCVGCTAKVFTCIIDGWLEEYFKKVATKSQKEPQSQVYKALKQEINF